MPVKWDSQAACRAACLSRAGGRRYPMGTTTHNNHSVVSRVTVTLVTFVTTTALVASQHVGTVVVVRFAARFAVRLVARAQDQTRPTGRSSVGQLATRPRSARRYEAGRRRSHGADGEGEVPCALRCAPAPHCGPRPALGPSSAVVTGERDTHTHIPPLSVLQASRLDCCSGQAGVNRIADWIGLDWLGAGRALRVRATNKNKNKTRLLCLLVHNSSVHLALQRAVAAWDVRWQARGGVRKVTPTSVQAYTHAHAHAHRLHTRTRSLTPVVGAKSPARGPANLLGGLKDVGDFILPWRKCNEKGARPGRSRKSFFARDITPLPALVD